MRYCFFFLLVHKKDFIKFFIIIIQFLFTFLVKGPSDELHFNILNTNDVFLTSVLFTFTLFKDSYLSDVSASFTDHSTLLPLIHFSLQPSLQKLNGFSDFMQCSDWNVFVNHLLHLLGQKNNIFRECYFGSQRHYKLTHLCPAMAYTFRVAARNDIGMRYHCRITCVNIF